MRAFCMTKPQAVTTLADQINQLLPQTQCTKCGYPACKDYATAIATGLAPHNQCPPGGQEGISKLAQLLGKPELSLNPANGIERRRQIAFIDDNACIGCTLCIQACPVDAIMGANKQMHTVIPALCTGCDLCLPPCPVDCITMIESESPATGWQAWSQDEANAARLRFESRTIRLEKEKQENDARLLRKAHEKLAVVSAEIAATQTEVDEKERKKKIIADAIQRAAAKRSATQQ